MAEEPRRPLLLLRVIAGQTRSIAAGPTAMPRSGEHGRGTNSQAPLFSVVIPVYNRARVIGTAIESVRAQAHQSFEILVIDDGSSDEICQVMAGFGDPRIRFVQQANGGASAARNLGLDLARGRFVAFLDSDDVFLPGHLAAMAAVLEGREKTVAYSPVRAIRGRGIIVRPPRPIGPGEAMSTYLMCDRGFVQTSGLVVPVEAGRAVRYRRDASYGDDTDFAVRLQLAGYRFVMTQTPTVDWFDGPDPERLSSATIGSGRLAWLEDLRDHIPQRAYRGYRGWHIAKGLFGRHPLLALALYARALVGGSYGPGLACVVLAQVVMPSRAYRRLSDFVLRIMTRGAPRTG